MNKIFIGLIFMFSCTNVNPYSKFEEELVDQVCKCISLRNITDETLFETKYKECAETTSELLKHGLDKYTEDPRMAKEEYKNRLPKLIQDIVKFNKCRSMEFE